VDVTHYNRHVKLASCRCPFWTSLAACTTLKDKQRNWLRDYNL
jgi:hypothetical protein